VDGWVDGMGGRSGFGTGYIWWQEIDVRVVRFLDFEYFEGYLALFFVLTDLNIAPKEINSNLEYAYDIINRRYILKFPI